MCGEYDAHVYPITLGVDRLDEAYQNIKDFVKEVKYGTKKTYDDFNRWVIDNTLKNLGDF
ncbi:hypothetical protein KHQ81_08375 [Mycoplasmatota bacterium]|nr:hypothetical protein KHQ81_08375 [Mycoplasmatota bacterium]